MIQEVLILALAVAAAAALLSIGGGLVADTAAAAFKLAEYRALYVLPMVHVVNGDVWLCFNSTRTPTAAYNATDGRPLKIHNDCYIGPLYCRAWIGPLKPGDRVTYIVQGERAGRAVTLELNSISIPQK